LIKITHYYTESGGVNPLLFIDLATWNPGNTTTRATVRNQTHLLRVFLELSSIACIKKLYKNRIIVLFIFEEPIKKIKHLFSNLDIRRNWGKKAGSTTASGSSLHTQAIVIHVYESGFLA